MSDLESSTQTRILNAAVELLNESGEASLRMQSVAERAGMSTGAIYATFPSREALVAAAHVERMSRWTNQIMQGNRWLVPFDVTGVETEEHTFDGVVAELVGREGRTSRLAWAEGVAAAQFNPPLAAALHRSEREFLDSTAAQVRHMQDAGILRDDVDARAITAIRLAISIGVALTSRVYDDDPEFEAKLAHIWPLVASAFAVRKSPASAEPKPHRQ